MAEGMGLALAVSIALVLIFLLAALRSVKLIAATFATLIVGLVLTFAFAFLTIGSLNLISVGFAVMFIASRSISASSSACATARSASSMARSAPWAKPAARWPGRWRWPPRRSRSALPPSFRPPIARLGARPDRTGRMAITLVLNFTLLPALLTLMKPRSAPREMGFPGPRPWMPSC